MHVHIYMHIHIYACENIFIYTYTRHFKSFFFNFKKITHIGHPRHDRRVAICFILKYTCKGIYKYFYVYTHRTFKSISFINVYIYMYTCIFAYKHTHRTLET